MKTKIRTKKALCGLMSGLLLLAGLLACTLPASAVSITINEDSATRLDFTVIWGLEATAPLVGETPPPALAPDGLYHANGFVDDALGGDVMFIGLFASYFVRENPAVSYLTPLENPHGGIGINLFFHYPIPVRTLSNAFLQSDGNVLPHYIYELEGEPAGARFVFGEANAPTGVPDSGSTLVLLAGALGTLGWFKRRFRPARPHVDGSRGLAPPPASV